MAAAAAAAGVMVPMLAMAAVAAAGGDGPRGISAPVHEDARLCAVVCRHEPGVMMSVECLLLRAPWRGRRGGGRHQP